MAFKKGFAKLALISLLGVAGATAVLFPSKKVISKSPAAECTTCSLGGAAGTRSTALACLLESVDANVAGNYQFVVTYNGQPITGTKLVGDFTFGTAGNLPMPKVLPAGGTDELVVTDSDGEAIGEVSLFVGKTSVLASDAPSSPQPLLPRQIAVGAHRTLSSARAGVAGQGSQVGSQQVSQAGVPPNPSPTLPDEFTTHEADITPLTDKQVCPAVILNGSTYYSVPIRPHDDLAVDPNFKVLIKKPGNSPVEKGKKCRVREPQDGKPCPSPIKPFCTPPSTTAVGAPASQSVSLGLGLFGFSGSITVSYWSQPYKRVTKCDVYKCVNGVLVYDHTEKCVNMGSQAWSFSPSAYEGNSRTGVLFGYDVNGWMWQAFPTCTKI